MGKAAWDGDLLGRKKSVTRLQRPASASHCGHDVVATSDQVTLIPRRNNVVCPVSYH